MRSAPEQITLSADKVKNSYNNDGVTTTAKENDMYELSLNGNGNSALFKLSGEIDLKNCTRVTFAVSGQTESLNFSLYDNTWYTSACTILGAYGNYLS